jgi:7-carboxy-7-deazaguanine synthase
MSAPAQDTLVVNEIFHSLQGESTYAGVPCVFVRLTGCNLRCNYCDTEYAFHEGTRMSLEEVLERVRAYGCRTVEITGGEPLLQASAHPLIAGLLDEGHTVLVETGGGVPLDGLDSRAVVIYDVKCPDSGECASNVWDNLDKLDPKDQVKFVISSRRDYEWMVEVLRERDLPARFAVLVSVAYGRLEPARAADWILEDRLPVRFQLQMHKYIWSPDARGV